jgi:hypothetical protein
MNYKLTVKKGDARLVVEHEVETMQDAEHAPFAFRELIQLFSNIPEAKVSIDPILLQTEKEEI